jgi:hypothetical protein
MSPAGDLRGMLEEAAARAQPKADWEGAARLARRMARLRLAAATAAATLAAGALLAGGVAARAALSDRDQPAPARAPAPPPATEPERGGVPRTETARTVRTAPDRPNLTLDLQGSETGGGALVLISNVGKAPAGGFTVAFDGDDVGPQGISIDGLQPNEVRRSKIRCTGDTSGRVDTDDSVQESNEEDNTDTTVCGASRPPPPPPHPPPTETSP